MCWEDVQIGRATGATTRIVSVGSTATELVPQSYDRFAVFISAPLSGRVTISTEPNVTDQQGVMISGVGNGLILNVRTSGSLVMQRLFAVADTGTVTVGVMEALLPQGFNRENIK